MWMSYFIISMPRKEKMHQKTEFLLTKSDRVWELGSILYIIVVFTLVICNINYRLSIYNHWNLTKDQLLLKNFLTNYPTAPLVLILLELLSFKLRLRIYQIINHCGPRRLKPWYRSLQVLFNKCCFMCIFPNKKIGIFPFIVPHKIISLIMVYM